MRLIPLFDKIVLRHITTAQKSDLILPETISESPSLGEVVYVGKGGTLNGSNIQLVVKESDRVLFHKFVASEFTFQNEQLYIIKQSDILCIVEDGDE